MTTKISTATTVILGKNGEPFVVEEHIENTLDPAIQISSSMITPHFALNHIQERDDELHRVLGEAGCTGRPTVQAGYDVEKWGDAPENYRHHPG
jgi:hypothetical protein